LISRRISGGPGPSWWFTEYGAEGIFCDPYQPWQRGSNESTHGLLRKYFPKSTDLSIDSPERLAKVAAELNGRPRKTVNGHTLAEAFEQLLPGW
jgi:IS30 family transposase